MYTEQTSDDETRRAYLGGRDPLVVLGDEDLAEGTLAKQLVLEDNHLAVGDLDLIELALPPCPASLRQAFRPGQGDGTLRGAKRRARARADRYGMGIGWMEEIRWGRASKLPFESTGAEHTCSRYNRQFSRGATCRRWKWCFSVPVWATLTFHLCTTAVEFGGFVHRLELVVFGPDQPGASPSPP